MKDKDNILGKFDKKAGFKVHNSYFEDFAKNLTNTLPDVDITPVEKPNTWLRVRPYVYMAAMFAGIWCMMKVFGSFSNPNPTIYNSEIVAGFQHEANIDEFLMRSSVSDYDLLNYTDSVMIEEQSNSDNINQQQ